MTTRTQQLETAARKLANAVERDMNGTMGKGGNGGLLSDTTLRAAHEVHAILNRPEDEADPALSDVARVIEESGGWWHSCSGCYDTEDGHPTAPYPYSKALRCNIGGGCHECGGLGAVWNYYSEEVLADMQKETAE